MSKKAVPDAWDDDWESQADRDVALEPKPQPTPDPKPTKLTQFQRRAQQAEFNRELWESAQRESEPRTFHFLEQQRSAVPLKQEYKPVVKVLSRRPAGAGLGVGGLSLEDDDEEGSSGKKPELTMEERQARAKKEREEKQKKYEEARERLFGSPTPSGSSSPGTTTPPKQGYNGRGRGRGRGGARAESRNTTQATAARSQPTGQLYDPNYSPKPDSMYQQVNESLKSSSDNLIQPIRAPRGPDSSGRAGFAARGRGT